MVPGSCSGGEDRWLFPSRWTCMAHPTLDRLGEERPFHLHAACSSVGSNTDDSGDEHFLVLCGVQSKVPSSVNSAYPHNDLV